MKSETIYFVSDLINVQSPQDNPGECLARFLGLFFQADEFPEKNVVQKDGTWRVNLMQHPQYVWIGCTGERGAEFTREYFDEEEQGITWSCFLEMEEPIRGRSKETLDLFTGLLTRLKDKLYQNQDVNIVKEKC
ncbi:hypothetical protein HCH_03497 [Hahella chejuensis KCTC 2396]|uniref:Uncharacterized protein n=1 Tax=Hahella chejuensis (strain KCTC 2396) TaxID=349521 RepID=Q2SGI1_HAHCH|nr:hypothetical protein [Hahella chejuensis]ABC30243.1 hypothetical protein HCH_03497 [Hahella chejuensis KCTC 2396]